MPEGYDSLYKAHCRGLLNIDLKPTVTALHALN